MEPEASNDLEVVSPVVDEAPWDVDSPEPRKRRWFPQFRLRTILSLILLSAILCAWWRDRSQLAARIDELENPPAALASWSIDQVLGKPDTNGYGDIPTAWASSTQDGQKEWLDLTYGVTLTPKQILIYETYNPGAVYRVTGFDSNGVERLLWQGTDPKKPGSGAGVSRITPKYRLRTNRIKVYIDSPKVVGWNEIDAVGVKDRFGKVYWAEKAKASTTYGVSRQIFAAPATPPFNFPVQFKTRTVAPTPQQPQSQTPATPVKKPPPRSGFIMDVF